MPKVKHGLKDVEITTLKGEVKIRLWYSSEDEPIIDVLDLITIPMSNNKVEMHITTAALRRALEGYPPIVLEHGKWR